MTVKTNCIKRERTLSRILASAVALCAIGAALTLTGLTSRAGASPGDQPAPAPQSPRLMDQTKLMDQAKRHTSQEQANNGRVAAIQSQPAPSTLPAQPQTTVDETTAARLTLDNYVIDFGRLYEEHKVSSKVVYRNTGKSTLMNIEFHPACGCTVAKPTHTVLEPGEAGSVEITFDPKGKPGRTTKTVQVRSSDPFQPNQTLRLEADYVPLVQITPPIIQFGTVIAGNPGKAVLTVLSRDKDFTIKEVKINNEYVEAHPANDDLPNTDPLYPGRIVLDFVLSNKAPTGSVSGVAELICLARIDGQGELQEVKQTVNFMSHILGDLVSDPRFIRVAQAFPNESFDSSIILTSASGRPFNVTSTEVLESTLPNVTARAEPYDNGAGLRGYKLILEGKGGASVGMFRGIVEVKTDLPNESPAKIPFNGFVREKPVIEGSGG